MIIPGAMVGVVTAVESIEAVASAAVGIKKVQSAKADRILNILAPWFGCGDFMRRTPRPEAR
jgi:hypothetical protein